LRWQNTRVNFCISFLQLTNDGKRFLCYNITEKLNLKKGKNEMKKIRSKLSGYVADMCRASQIILISGLSLTLCSLLVTAFFFFSPSVSDSETALWLHKNLHILIDTVLSSLSITLLGAFIMNYSYKNDKKK